MRYSYSPPPPPPPPQVFIPLPRGRFLIHYDDPTGKNPTRTPPTDKIPTDSPSYGEEHGSVDVVYGGISLQDAYVSSWRHVEKYAIGGRNDVSEVGKSWSKGWPDERAEQQRRRKSFAEEEGADKGARPVTSMRGYDYDFLINLSAADYPLKPPQLMSHLLSKFGHMNHIEATDQQSHTIAENR
jgi:hypothetical protein